MNTKRSGRALRLASATFILGTLALVGPFDSKQADAEVEARLARARTLTEKASSSSNAESYAAIRKLWGEWDQGDPAAVEEGLRAVASARTGSPRVYAQLLGGYARRRRGDLDGAKRIIGSLGYVSSWMVVGPFDNEGKAGFPRAFEPEVDGAPTVGKSYDGKERKVAWRVAPARAQYGWLDFGALVRPIENGCSYATTFVHDASLKKGQSRTISMWIGSAGAVRVWWNGTMAIEDAKYREFDSERLARSVTLVSGENRVLVKACGTDGAPVFAVRFADDRGLPDAKIEASADPTRGALSTVNWTKPALPAASVEGPIQTFDKAVKAGDPATQEAYARYLVSTSGDDEAEHIARDLATKAAKKSPTVARCLLAGDLSENRNQEEEWIVQAEALVKKGGVSDDDKMLTLLSRAAHARSGVNWRDAIPYYDQALALDRDNVTAILARVELYGEANLRATALAFLQQALARRPRSVALLRETVSALRQEDRSTEADEAEERYAELRFDDTEYARRKIGLYVARREPTSAARWIDRLVDLDPDDPVRLSTAAGFWITLGDRTRATAAYKRALDLAPEDTDVMRSLADLQALSGNRSEQEALLRRVVELKPQAKDVRDYLAHLTPEKPKEDELYAVASKDFLANRGAPAGGKDRRTLVDLTVGTVFPNGLSSKFRQVVYQPLTDRAAQDGRGYGFAYESDSQTVQLRGVKVYKTDGTVDESYTTSVGGTDDPSMAMYTSASAFRVRVPRLAAGDVVEIMYRIEDVAERNAFADYFGDVAYLASDEPVARAEYVLITPKTRTFYFNEPKIPNLVKSVEEKGDKRVYRFAATNLPALDSEPLMPPYTETLGRIHVSTYKSWDEMGTWYWGLVKDQFVADDEVRKRVTEITKGKTTDREKMTAVYDYVVQKTRYVALEFGIHGFKPYRAAQIFARGYGDCKDKATLIVTMLKELGIPATIVIVRTGLRGDFDDYPASLAPFDHAIAYVPAFDLYLDGTAEYSGTAELPAMDRGSLAIQINEGKPKLVHLPDPPASASTVTRRIDATVAADGSAQIEWTASSTGVYAPSWRVRYHAEALRKQRVEEDLGNELPGIAITNVTANDLENVELGPVLKVTGKVPALARKDGDKLSLPAGPKEHMVTDFASLSTRKQDIRLRAQNTQITERRIKLPANAQVSTAPTASTSDSPFGSHSVTVEKDGATYVVKTTVTMKKTRITAAEYPAFRAWCEQVDKALGQRLVFKMGGAP